MSYYENVYVYGGKVYSPKYDTEQQAFDDAPKIAQKYYVSVTTNLVKVSSSEVTGEEVAKWDWMGRFDKRFITQKPVE